MKESSGDKGAIWQCRACGCLLVTVWGRTRCDSCLVKRFGDDRLLTTELLDLQAVLGSLVADDAGSALLMDLGALRAEVDRFLGDAWRPRLGAQAALYRRAAYKKEHCQMLVLTTPVARNEATVFLSGPDGASLVLTISKGEFMGRVEEISATISSAILLLRWAALPHIELRPAPVALTLTLHPREP